VQRIYIVEDDEDIREIVVYALNSAGFEAKGFESARDFFAEIDEELPALVLLDIMLPGEDGLTVLKSLKNTVRTSKLPVIMMTAKDSEFDKVRGLDMGADDYIPKPFGVMELLSRVKAVLRRVGADEDKITESGGLKLDSARREVTVDGREITLTYKEYELLQCLMTNSGLVLSRDKLMEIVWGYDYEGESRTIDMHIKALRQKLGDAGELIKTIRGVGYKMENIK
jgi:two-component system alkaline phosphatase synthesis response regulator PhoP